MSVALRIGTKYPSILLRINNKVPTSWLIYDRVDQVNKIDHFDRIVELCYNTQVMKTSILKKLKNYVKNAFRMLALYYRSNKLAFSLLLLSIVLVSFIPFLQAYLFKLIIDKIVEVIKQESNEIDPFIPLLIAIFVLSFAQRFLWRIIEYFEKISSLDFGKYIEIMVEEKYSSLGFEHFNNPKTNDLLNRLRETYSWRPLNFANRQLWIIQNIVEIITNTTAIILLNIWVYIAILLSAIPEFLIHMKYGKDVWNIHVAKGPIRRDFWQTSWYLKEERYLEEIRIFQVPNYLIQRIKNLYKSFISPEKKKVKKRFYFSTLGTFITLVTFTSSQIYVIILTISQRITIGSLEFYISRIRRLSDNLNSFFRNIGKSYEDILYVNDLFAVLALESNVVDTKDAIELKTKAHTIEFKNVSFKYPKAKRYVLKNFNLTIKPNDKIALIGENGGGKTTIIRLFCRFYDVTDGEILIDGTNIKNIKLASWYKCLGVLFQDYNRYAYTVRDNVRIGDVDKPYEKKLADQALKKAQALSFVKEYKKKEKTRLSKEFKDGIEPSTGQWQKIALARAFFRDAPILILDEPTAAIDAKAEAEIFNQLEQFEKNKTVIMISHRFSTVRNADKIFVIDKGRIVEGGSHEALMKKKGKYSDLFSLQAKGYQK